MAMVPRLLIPAARPDALGTLQPDHRQRHYLRRVLRLGAGDAVQVFDGSGRRWQARIAPGQDDLAILRVEAELPPCPESRLQITLAQGLSTAERMDWTVEKAVELGAADIVPLACARSQVRLDAERAARKHDHWRAVVEAACMQSGRDRLPALHAVQPLPRWVAAPGRAGLRLVLDPNAATALSERFALDSQHALGITVLVGPESGLSSDELRLAYDHGFEGVRLGPRVLRTETAGLAALAALQALAGDY